jgi:hypothetical protein
MYVLGIKKATGLKELYSYHRGALRLIPDALQNYFKF